MSGPVISRACLGNLDFVGAREIGINSEVPIVHTVSCSAAEDDQAEAKQSSATHKENLLPDFCDRQKAMCGHWPADPQLRARIVPCATTQLKYFSFHPREFLGK